jgi:hypothetical protein
MLLMLMMLPLLRASMTTDHPLLLVSDGIGKRS